jgi:hypothetical protein
LHTREHETGRFFARLRPAGRKAIALAAGSALTVSALQGCSREADPEEDPSLPSAWHTARIDPTTGGRYLPLENSELARFQDRILRSGSSIPYPHYHDSRTVVMAVNSGLINERIRRRVEFLLDNEASDPDLSVLVVTDQSPEIVAERLGVDDGRYAERLSLVQIAHQGPAHVSFPFLRDYAPLVRAKPTPDGARTTGLVLFKESTLNKVIDRRLGVKLERKESTVREKFDLTKKLIDVYKDRIGHPVEIHHLDLLMDGGNLITDGRGTCFFTRVFLDKNDRSRDFIEKELADKAGCLRSVFLAAPQRLDSFQHVDTLLYFADPQNVILSMPTLYESDRIAEFENLRDLLAMGYKVHRLPRKTASITYANILTTTRNVYVPQYSLYKIESREQLAINRRIRKLYRKGQLDLAASLLSQPIRSAVVEADSEVRRDNRRALEVVQRLLPEKRVVPADSDETIHTMGSWHCLTHELPERL